MDHTIHVGNTVKVVCEDTGLTQSGLVERISRNNVASISISPKVPVMMFSESKPGVWVCRTAGLEFVVKA